MGGPESGGPGDGGPGSGGLGRLRKEVGPPGHGETVAQTCLALRAPQLLPIAHEDPGPGLSLRRSLERPLPDTVASTGPSFQPTSIREAPPPDTASWEHGTPPPLHLRARGHRGRVGEWGVR